MSADRGRGRFLVVAAIVIVALAVLAGSIASSEPDGLEKVAETHGFADTAQAHAFEDAPLADYATAGVRDEGLSAGLAGTLGVLVTFAVGAGVVWLVTRRTTTGRGDELGGPGEPGGPSDSTVPGLAAR